MYGSESTKSNAGANNALDSHFPKNIVDTIATYHYCHFNEYNSSSHVVGHHILILDIRMLGNLENEFDINLRINIRRNIKLMGMLSKDIEHTRAPLANLNIPYGNPYRQYEPDTLTNGIYWPFPSYNGIYRIDFLNKREQQLVAGSYYAANMKVPSFVYKAGISFDCVFPKIAHSKYAGRMIKMIDDLDLDILREFIQIFKCDSEYICVEKNITEYANGLDVSIINRPMYYDAFFDGDIIFLHYLITRYSEKYEGRIRIHLECQTKRVVVDMGSMETMFFASIKF
jgi:hypothetical protein